MISSIAYPTDLIGSLTLATDGKTLVGCWFNEGRYFGYGLKEKMNPVDAHPVLSQACMWLNRYFAGEQPDPHELPLNPGGSVFQKRVWRILADIPYGETVTYGDIAKRLEEESGKRSSARAVGGAVGHNPLCVIVPCHRVVGANGSLTGFGGGIATKVKLLEHEHANMDGFFIPKRGTAL
ncbi:MAG: methylated-DNA--[protein]-cysteine S-methyltransferase [Eggerthellaceae bacterium]|nr:methylated-DNA--[protein]-cysteine S-methyltransferase [Eggerthellaceae bacterium]